MKKIIYLTVLSSILLIICYFVFTNVFTPRLKTLDANNYTRVNALIWGDINSTEKEKIEIFTNLINSARSSRSLFWVDMNKSPDLVIEFTKTDGGKDKYWIYGNYIRHFTDEVGKQYKISNVDNFYKAVYELSQSINSDNPDR